jgi:hypothetical protein
MFPGFMSSRSKSGYRRTGEGLANTGGAIALNSRIRRKANDVSPQADETWKREYELLGERERGESCF